MRVQGEAIMMNPRPEVASQLLALLGGGHHVIELFIFMFSTTIFLSSETFDFLFFGVQCNFL